jgi:hypothetical protein
MLVIQRRTRELFVWFVKSFLFRDYDLAESDYTLLQDQITEKIMECEIAYKSRSLEEDYKIGGADTCGVAVNVSDSMQNKETCITEEASAFKNLHPVNYYSV